MIRNVNKLSELANGKSALGSLFIDNDLWTVDANPLGFRCCCCFFFFLQFSRLNYEVRRKLDALNYVFFFSYPSDKRLFFAQEDIIYINY